MSKYEILVAIHVLMAVVWVGGNVMIQILAFRTLRADDSHQLVLLSRNIEWVGTRVFMPASVILLIFGIWAASDANFDFGSPWITLGFVGFLASFLVGMGFLGPQSGKLAKVIEAEGEESPAAAAIIRRLLSVSRAELVLLLVVVVAMVGKWGA